MPPKSRRQGQNDAGTTTSTKATPAKTSKGTPQKKKQTETAEKGAASRKVSAGPTAGQSAESAPREAFDDLLEPYYQGKGLTDKIDTARDKWTLLPAFLKVKGLVKQHIDSFNYFVESELKNILKANEKILSDVNDRFFFKYTDIRIGRPNRQTEDDLRNHISDITPNECRLRDMTYAAPIFVDYQYWRNGATIYRKGTRIGRLPIMLRSSKCVLNGKSDGEMGKLQECSVDPGGYFIIKGQEKVILVQEQLSKNRIIVESQKGITQASVTSTTHERKSKTYVLLKKGRIYLRHNVINEDVPIVILLKAMGVERDQDILVLVAGTDEVYQGHFASSFEEAIQRSIHTQHQALEWIGSRVRIKREYGPYQSVRNIQQQAIEALASVVITHVPVKGIDFRPKALYVAFMTHRVLMAMHDPTLVDDRDYVGNKRLELAGQMLSLLFEDVFKRFNADLKATIDKKMIKKNSTNEFDAHHILRYDGPRHITAGMERAIATGNWNLKRFKMERAGVTHVLSRLSYISALGMMTRITSQFEKTRKISGPRALQTSQFGMLCPSDTPEGEACGLVKNLALMTHITTQDKEGSIRTTVKWLGAEELTSVVGFDIYSKGSHIVIINGTPFARTRDPIEFLKAFKRFRRTGRISEFVSIHINYHHKAVHIATDEGRICRPLIIVDKGNSRVTENSLELLRSGRMTFDDFLSRGIVEYLDVNEENDSNIAVYEDDITQETTHLEIEPFTMLGAVAGLIPYPHHNQSPRNTYQCAMGKQAIGSIAYNQFTRIDALLYLMVYPQKPLVKTRALELVKYDKLPAGQNAIVAVMSYSGYDIEDALVLNKASCDRGFGRCQVFKKQMAHLRTYANGSSDHLGTRTADKVTHRNIGSDGIVEVGSRLKNGDVYLIKNTPVNSTASGVGSDYGDDGYNQLESAYKVPDPSYVDKVMLSANEAETRVLKVHTRQTRRPEVGDKFSSRHGQKGVVGIIAEQTDMPFTDSGITPDVIMNPHGFPSRMTVGKMLELISGKAGVMRGTSEYGTAFGGSKIEEMGDVLVQNGFSYSGKDYMTCGITGEPLSAYIFHGPIYYQKLKHMVQDKMHSRSTGTRAMLSRQPNEGRARGGGLRLGEMERDCLIAYGASRLLLERLMLSSDKHQCEVCEYCGMMGYQGWCQTCKTGEGVVRMVIPYAAKLLMQELVSMNIKATFKLEDQLPGE